MICECRYVRGGAGGMWGWGEGELEMGGPVDNLEIFLFIITVNLHFDPQ